MSIIDKIAAIWKVSDNTNDPDFWKSFDPNTSSGPNNIPIITDPNMPPSQQPFLVPGNQQIQISPLGVPMAPYPNLPTHTWHQTTNGTIGKKLTPEEEKELKVLEEDYNARLKEVKLEKFRSLPKEFRQTIITMLSWSQVVEEIDDISIPMSDRHIELAPAKMSMGALHRLANSFRLGYNGNKNLPDDITLTDLAKAHTDACMEEALSE